MNKVIDASYNDVALFALTAEGNEEAFRQVFHRYNRSIYPFVYSLVKSDIDAREIIQDVFLKLWLQRDSLPSITNPGGWLHTVAANEAYSHLRNRARYELKLRNLTPSESAGTDLEQELDAKFIKSLINEAVSRLPPRRREVFTLSRLEGYSRKEIAGKLAISEHTVRNQLVEAVEFVQGYLQKHGSRYISAILLCAHFF
jgi:RNA polymerase sigma-70 factor (family 1)